MQKKAIFFIALIMFIALSAVMFVQYHWLDTAYFLSRSTFDEKVNSSIQHLVEDMEKQEIFKYFAQQDAIKSLKKCIDSTQNELSILEQSYPYLSLMPDSTTADSHKQKHAQIKHRLYILQTNYDNFRNVLGLNDDNFLGENKFSPYILDSLIEKTLLEENIKTEIEWGIYSQIESKLLLQKTGNYGKELILSPYTFKLYPNLNLYDFYLCLYFPNQKSFITSQIATLLFSSFILVSILVFVFIYTLYSIISQQKLTTMKNDFINHVTHEIKTPISTISLICESFNDSDMHYDKQSTLDAIKIIQHESDRLSSLSRQIIELSKLENGDYFLNKTNFDLHQAIDDAINNTGFQVMHKKGKIYLNLSAQNSWIFGDKTHITHIISNIIDNANKYNSEKPSIHISSQNVKNGIQIDIQDNGIGINKQHLKKIFNKLYRIPTGNTHDIKGFGLGLSYVKSIVLQHQGKVWVESEPKKGSTFHLFFPQNL